MRFAAKCPARAGKGAAQAEGEYVGAADADRKHI